MAAAGVATIAGVDGAVTDGAATIDGVAVAGDTAAVVGVTADVAPTLVSTGTCDTLDEGPSGVAVMGGDPAAFTDGPEPAVFGSNVLPAMVMALRDEMRPEALPTVSVVEDDAIAGSD